MRKVVFYRTAAGGEIVRDFIRSQSKEDRLVIGEDLMVVQKGFPIGLPVCDSLGHGLWEVRSSLPSKREARLIFFHHSVSNTLVVVHGFIKKSQKTPDAALKIANRRKAELEKQE
jgi:phage-related protein